MSKRPNIVYVIPDEFRQRAMGFLGKDPVVTPNLDRFAAQSLYLSHAVSSFPVCSPYRGMLFSGQYPFSNGVVGNCNTEGNRYGVYLRPHKECLTDIFARNGYDCGYIGKWHLDSPELGDVAYLEARRADDGKIWDAFTPKHRRHGFNFWYSYGCHDDHFHPHYWATDDSLEDMRCFEEWSPVIDANVAVDYITNKGGVMRDEEKPFLLFVASNPPHMPFEQVPDRYKKLYEGKSAEDLLTSPCALSSLPEEIPQEWKERAAQYQGVAQENVLNYFAAVSGIDEQFGRILDAIKEKGIEEDTIVIFTSDHGEMMGSHSMMYKGYWYDDSFRVPFLIRYPGHIEPGEKDGFLNPPDLLPTLLELAGLSDQIPSKTEGVSCAGWLCGDADPIRDEGYFVNPEANVRGVANQDWLFVVIRDMHDNEQHILYDSKNDPDQMHNVAKEHPEIVRAMRERLTWWLYHTNDLWVQE